MVSGESVRVRNFVRVSVIANPTAAPQNREGSGFNDGQTGPQDDKNTGKAQDERDDPPSIEALPQKQNRQNGGPDWRRELDGKNFGQRQQADPCDPAQLRAKMNDVAPELGPQMRRAPDRCSGADCEGQQDDKCSQAAEQHDLEAVDFAGNFADSNSHQGEGQQRAGHPEDGLDDRRHWRFFHLWTGFGSGEFVHAQIGSDLGQVDQQGLGQRHAICGSVGIGRMRGFTRQTNPVNTTHGRRAAHLSDDLVDLAFEIGRIDEGFDVDCEIELSGVRDGARISIHVDHVAAKIGHR